jgi:predicted RNase H-like HicB family nuclease
LLHPRPSFLLVPTLRVGTQSSPLQRPGPARDAGASELAPTPERGSQGNEGFYGEIPECRGVFANAQTLEACREQLAEVLEDWVLLRVSRNLDLPIIDGAEIRLREVA